MKKNVSRIPVLILSACIFTMAARAQSSGTWSVTGSIAKYASGPSSNLMLDGKVLTAGGNLGGGSDSSEEREKGKAIDRGGSGSAD